MLLFLTSLLQKNCIRTITSGGKRAEEGHNMAITHNQNSDDKKSIFMVVSLLLKHQQRSPPFLKVKPGVYAILQSSAHPIYIYIFFCAFQMLSVACQLLSLAFLPSQQLVGLCFCACQLLFCHLSNWLTSILCPVFFTYLKKGYAFETSVSSSLVHNCFLASLDVDLYY